MRTQVAVMYRSIFHVFYSETKIHCLTERQIAEKYNVDHRTLSRRLRRGFNINQAIGKESPPPRLYVTKQQKAITQAIKRLTSQGLRL